MAGQRLIWNKKDLIALLIISVVIFALIIIWLVRSQKNNSDMNINLNNTKESDMNICQKDSDCIIVPYSSCCGSTKRAINKKYKRLYESHPEWQKFDDPKICRVIGMCPPDYNLKNTSCSEDKRCQLKE